MGYTDPEARRAAHKRDKLRRKARMASDPEYREQENAKAREYRRQRAAVDRAQKRLRYKARMASDPEYREQRNAQHNDYYRRRQKDDPRYKEQANRRGSEWYALHREAIRERATERRRKLRADTLATYGGKCACCGESTQEFLAIDHINGGGNKHRRSLNMPGSRAAGGTHFYAWLAKQGYPAGFRVLCHNCNFARGAYGYCPHEQEARP